MTAIFISFVGVLGTILGAAFTAFVAARTEQRRKISQDRVLLNDLRVEHQRWRRERRQAAYLSFLEALGAADRDNQALFRELRARRAPVPLDDTRIAAIRLKFKDAENAGLVVILEGPEAVAEASQNLVDQLSSLVQDVREYAEVVAADSLGNGGRQRARGRYGIHSRAKGVPWLAREALDDVAKQIQVLPGTELCD
ncbi:hypothetical protein [Streptomyces niveus]|uniref:hypothetical protein n=1 Tax=Streptomyces niveus TaxID=193462 RepID=UPI0036C17EE2